MPLETVISLLIFSFGVFAFGTLVVYQLRSLSADPSDPYKPNPAGSWHANAAGLAIWGLSLLWFLTLTIQTLFSLKPGFKTSAFDVILLGFQILFPPLIMHVFYAETAAPEQSHGWGWTAGLLSGYAINLSLGTWAMLVVFDLVPRPWPGFGTFLGFSVAGMFTVAAVYCMALMASVSKRNQPSTVRSSRRWMFGLFGFMIVLTIALVAGHIIGFPFTRALRVIGMSMPLVFCFVAFYHESRFAFFDLFVKRELALFTTVLVLACYLAVVLPMLDGLGLAGARPLVYAVVLLPAVGALPWMYRRLWEWLDSVWLGRRYRTVEAVKEFLSALQSATDERELVAQAEQGLARILLAPVRVDLELRQAPPLDFQCARSVPIRSDGEPLGAVLLGQRAKQMPYFSEDVALVESLADVLSHLIENMRLREKKQEQEQQARELSLQASRSELKALRAQINPHFLFNALNAIAGLIHKDPFRADNTVEQLAEVFRYTLRGSEKEWALLEDEMDFVRSYLDVEQARFGERLTVDVRVAEAVRRVRIPTMIVQTLVENAVKHGVSAVRGPARIEIDARRDGGLLVIHVADNGPGFDEAAAARNGAKGSSYGLRNIRERFAGYFGGDAELRVTRDEQRAMTVVSIAIPLDHRAVSNADADESGTAGGVA